VQVLDFKHGQISYLFEAEQGSDLFAELQPFFNSVEANFEGSKFPIMKDLRAQQSGHVLARITSISARTPLISSFIEAMSARMKRRCSRMRFSTFSFTPHYLPAKC
jgi:hypothetical protein